MKIRTDHGAFGDCVAAFHLLVPFALIVLFAGCRKMTPVEEVSVSNSGVKITNAETALTAADWASWRGPTGNGVAVEQRAPTNWGEGENIKWRVPVPGRGHSSPNVVGDLVVMGTTLRSAEQQSAVALDRYTGEEKWTAVIHSGGLPADSVIHSKATRYNGTFASDGVRLYTSTFNSGKIFVTALDLKGEKKWQKEIGAFNSKFGYAASPVLYKSLVIVAADNFGGGYIAALDSKTGELAWRTARSNDNTLSSPLVTKFGGSDQLLITGGGKFSSYNPATGEENWSTDFLPTTTCGTPVVFNDLAFASGGYPDNETICVDAKGNKIWSNNTRLYEPSLLVHNGLLFSFTDKGVGYCWDAKTGDEKWKKRLGGGFSSSPILSGGYIYVANLDGECFVLKPSGDDFEQVAKNKVGDDCYASPAAARDELFFRVGTGQGGQRQEELICISSQ